MRRPGNRTIVDFLVAMVLMGTVMATAQPIAERVAQIHDAQPNYRRVMAQLELVSASTELDDALASLQKLEDESEGRVTLYPSLPLNTSFGVQRYVPVTSAVAWKRAELFARFPNARDLYQSKKQRAIEIKLRELESVADMQSWKPLVQLATNTEWEAVVLMRMGDRYLQQGWIQAARDCYQRTSIALRAPVLLGTSSRVPLSKNMADPNLTAPEPEANRKNIEERSSVPWHLVLRKIPQSVSLDPAITDYLRTPSGPSLGATGIVAPAQIELLARMIWCSLLEGDRDRAKEERRLVERLCSTEESDGRDWLASIDRWFEQSLAWKLPSGDEYSPGGTFACSISRNAPQRAFGDATWLHPTKSDWYSAPIAWEHRLMRRSGHLESKSEGNSRLSEAMTGVLAYHPVIYRNRVFVNELGRILAFELDTGRSWPDQELNSPLYLHQRNDDLVVPMGYPTIGMPRGTLAIVDDRLYARVGTVVTGWRNVNEFVTRSQSAIVGLDLRREGMLLPGFPIILSGSDWRNAEFEGSPLVVDRDLFVMITQRLGVEVQRSIACFDAFSGTLRWRSPMIAGGWIPRSEQANIISHQLLSYSSGRIFADSGLGVIVALEAQTGKIEWLVRHPVVNEFGEAYPKSQRFRTRDLAPPLVYRDMVICAPASCREIFALDWSTGDFLWSSIEGEATDATQLLGVVDGKLVASGDRLWWLDLYSGKACACYPENGSDLPGFAAPYPRGLGRGVLFEDQIIWPTPGGLSIVQSKLNANEQGRLVPMLLTTVPLGPRLSEGANLVGDGRGLVLATPSRLIGLQPHPPRTSP